MLKYIMARKRRRKSKQSNKLTYYIIGAAVLILIIFAFPNVGKFTDAEESQWEGNLTIPGESEMGDIPVRYVKLSDGSFAVTNRPKNWDEINPSSGRGVGGSINVYFDHKALKGIYYNSTRSEYFAEDDVGTENYIMGPAYSLRGMIVTSMRHTISSPIIFGSYWIDYTGEARIDGKTPAEIEAVKAEEKAEEERKAAEEERKAAEEKAEEERKAAEEKAKQELEKKKQEAQKFLDEWEDIYFRYGVYETESKELRAVTYNRDNQQIIAVTNAPEDFAVDQHNEESSYIRYTQNEGQYARSQYGGSYRTYYQDLKEAIRGALISKKLPLLTTSHYWVDETGEVYNILEVHFAENQEDIKSQEGQGEPEMESLA